MTKTYELRVILYPSTFVSFKQTFLNWKTHVSGIFIEKISWNIAELMPCDQLIIEPTPEKSSLSPTFWLDPKSLQKDQDSEFDSLCRSYSEWTYLSSSKGFSSDFVTRCLAHELAAMLSISVWQCSLKIVEFYVGPDSISNFFLWSKYNIHFQDFFPAHEKM
jgi:hypothetical protein